MARHADAEGLVSLQKLQGIELCASTQQCNTQCVKCLTQTDLCCSFCIKHTQDCIQGFTLTKEMLQLWQACTSCIELLHRGLTSKTCWMSVSSALLHMPLGSKKLRFAASVSGMFPRSLHHCPLAAELKACAQVAFFCMNRSVAIKQSAWTYTHVV